MQMRINAQVLSIPPYISTSWRNVSALHLTTQDLRPTLIVTLDSGSRVEIPDLPAPILDAIFSTHAKYIEQEETAQPGLSQQGAPQFGMPFSFPMSFPFPIPGIEAMGGNVGNLLQHNPDLAHQPPLPPELLEKIMQMAKIFEMKDSAVLPEYEPHCNCFYCQIGRALRGEVAHVASSHDHRGEEHQLPSEEPVKEEDLKFRNWDIQQLAEKLFLVTNPMNRDESYRVFLGEPVGCTCGANGCEHITAVLRS